MWVILKERSVDEQLFSCYHCCCCHCCCCCNFDCCPSPYCCVRWVIRWSIDELFQMIYHSLSFCHQNLKSNFQRIFCAHVRFWKCDLFQINSYSLSLFMTPEHQIELSKKSLEIETFCDCFTDLVKGLKRVDEYEKVISNRCCVPDDLSLLLCRQRIHPTILCFQQSNFLWTFGNLKLSNFRWSGVVFSSRQKLENMLISYKFTGGLPISCIFS